MADREGPLPHLQVVGAAHDEAFRRRGGGDKKVRDVEHRAHGVAVTRQLERALEDVGAKRVEVSTDLDELQAVGSVIVLEGADAAYPLKLESLERRSRHRTQPKVDMWRLLSVTPARDGEPEKATVWVSDRYRRQFLRLFEDYRDKTTRDGETPRQVELVANIARIRQVIIDDLWQSDGSPPRTGTEWWELWLVPGRGGVMTLREFAAARGLEVHPRVLWLPDRTVAWLRAEWADLAALPFTAVPLTEVRRPEFIDTVEDLTLEDQDELTNDLVERLRPAALDAPAVCHLDTGVRRSHELLEGSLAESDMHSIVAGTLGDRQNHGTPMAGLALFGDLEPLLLSGVQVQLRHRLESVKLLPDSGGHDESAYGLATAQAVAMPEIAAPRARVFCMPVTAKPDRVGEPTLWSASVDALAAGVDIGASNDGIQLLNAPDPAASRLFVISAGNLAFHEFQPAYRDACDAAPIDDPAHSWNALTVGAHTERTAESEDPDFWGWKALAQDGDISPHSRTSVLFARQWPIKPDICMEGGNLLHDGAADYHPHPLLCLRTTDARGDRALGSANATSAATAQAARLAALAMAQYPDYWPETIRGLLTHGADWTPLMRSEVEGAPNKTQRLALLRRYGWGVPTESTVLDSSLTAVTLVSQDEFQPFDGDGYAMRVFRLHDLPWPVEVLRELGPAAVTLRVTLSYFIEPTASRRGWRRRYAYASHGLRFELRRPNEPRAEFIRRVNNEAQREEEGTIPGGTQATDWLVGPKQRVAGSLHQDVWNGIAADLAECGELAVYPVGGWWKNSKREDRQDLPVRYALIVSLKTQEQGVDLYTPVELAIGQRIGTQAIPAT